MKEKVFEIVNSIPKGKVTSYGVVGMTLGISGWEVGRFLSSLSDDLWDTVMWQRVVAKNGFISSVKLGFRGQLQKELLTKEGIEVEGDIVDMNKYGIDSVDLLALQ